MVVVSIIHALPLSIYLRSPTETEPYKQYHYYVIRCSPTHIGAHHRALQQCLSTLTYNRSGRATLIEDIFQCDLRMLLHQPVPNAVYQSMCML